MKSIDDTLKIIRDITSALPIKIDIVLIGGMAAILHGVERTTIDLDLCVYAETDAPVFFDMLVQHLPEQFTARLVEGSKIPDDSLRHDIIFIDDTEGEYERIDLLIARYKWEVEGMRRATHTPGVPFPVLGKPYLAAMKLLASGYKDAYDVVTLFTLMTAEERETTRSLANRIGRDKKLERLLAPPEDIVREMPEEYL